MRQAVMQRMSQAERAPDGVIVTPRLSRLECRVLPLRNNGVQLLSLYDRFFGHEALSLTDITGSVIARATDLRARYGLKTPDAIHVATAVEAQADLFLTGDRDMARFAEIRVEVL